jgi:hypothetical protein
MEFLSRVMAPFYKNASVCVCVCATHTHTHRERERERERELERERGGREREKRDRQSDIDNRHLSTSETHLVDDKFDSFLDNGKLHEVQAVDEHEGQVYVRGLHKRHFSRPQARQLFDQRTQ